jgi:hypothetical protein
LSLAARTDALEVTDRENVLPGSPLDGFERDPAR